MNPPSLVEVRTGGETKSDLRTIINDVAAAFDVQERVRSHVVPHVPLFGPYDTDRGREVKRRLVETLSAFDVVPYEITGFRTVGDGQMVAASVDPSVELISLRRQIRDALRPLTFDNPSRDSETPFEFHLPILDAGEVTNGDAATVLDYLDARYEPSFEEYATRITSLRGSEMLWEYDVLGERVLDPSEATSRDSWRRTLSVLDERASPADHRTLVTESVASVVAPASENGWAYFRDPPDHVTDRARRDGLSRSDGTMCRRGLYHGDNYVYLVVASARSPAGVHVLSREKSAFYDDTVARRCPICGDSSRRYDDERFLPCRHCGLQYELRDGAPDRDALSAADDPVMCVRCERPMTAGGIQFVDRIYCADCVDLFEAVADEGVVVRSRHGETDHDEYPYVVQWGDDHWTTDDQVTALARGAELTADHGVPGLFIYRRRGSHWLLDAYLDAHPDIRSKVRDKRREIRGENRVQVGEPIEFDEKSDADTYNIRADGNVIVAHDADAIVNDAVVNRAEVGNSGVGHHE